jgi:3-oxoacyl-[acyl-carrier-protein] synthase II
MNMTRRGTGRITNAMHRARRVAITGLGVVSPLGIGVDAFWDALSRGVSGVRRITKFDAASFPSQIAAEVRGFDPLAYLPRRDVVRTDTFIHYAIAAANEATADARLKVEDHADRVGVALGTAMGGIPRILQAHNALTTRGPRAMSPYAMPGGLPTMGAAWVSMRCGARGPIASPASACAAGSCAIGEALRMIQRGDADAMLAGGADALVHPSVLGSFCALHALSTRNAEPAGASRPFDKERDGFVLGEGAGVLVLEALDHAFARGARVHGELIGYGLTADAHHPTAPSPDGPARAIQLALRDAGLQPEAVDYINAHGTSAVESDAAEATAIGRVFGAHARRPAASSTKSMTGHLLGASGAVEAIATVLTLDHGLVPPTINYATPDPACDLDCVPNQARRMDVRYALSNSFAFGGTNAVLAFKQWDA